MPSTSETAPLNKIYLIGLWIETALWGVNTVMFSGVFYMLFWRSKSNNKHWVLAITSFLLYLCATLHVSISLRQELEAFVYTPQNAGPDYASLYFSQEGSALALTKNIIYATAAFLQDLVLIWRMYVVWERRWKIIVLPLIIELIHVACAYAAPVILTRPGIGLYSPVMTTLSFLGWPIELVVNVCVAGAITLRLWYIGRAVSCALSGTESMGLSKRNAYARPIFTLVESGSIFVAVSIAMLVLYNTGYGFVALMCLDIAVQVAALVPYLIILRVGLRADRAAQSSIETGKSLDQGGLRFTPKTPLASGSKAFRSGTIPSLEDIERDSIDLSEMEAQQSLEQSSLDV